MRPVRTWLWSAAILALIVVAGSFASFWWLRDERPATVPSPKLSFERLTNTFFTPDPPNAFAPPEVRFVRLPTFPAGAAVWGATGRDDYGNIWIGVSIND